MGQKVLARVSWMLESEWVRPEDNFWAVVDHVGLRVHGLPRLSRKGEQIIDLGDAMGDSICTALEDIYEKEPH